MKSIMICASLSLGTLAALPAIASDATPILHPVEAACIDYEMSGQMMSGTTTRCHRDYAYEQYEIQNMSVGFGGFTQAQNQHTITIGNMIYAIDLSTNTGTQTVNPVYDGLVSALEDSSPEEMGAAFINAMGYTASGQSKTIAGVNCGVYNSAQLGSVCLTDDGLMLEQSVMGTTTIATSVSIGDGGDDANYTLYQNVPISQGPDLSNMPDLQNLLQGFGQ